MTDVLSLTDVTKTYGVKSHTVPALQGVDLSLAQGRTLAVIGESGAGKTTLARVAVGLESPSSGRASFRGQSWSVMKTAEQRRSRSSLSIVFQTPALALDPRMTVSDCVLEPIRLHRSDISRSNQEECARVAMKQANLSLDLWDRYPRGLSGGEQQRVGIARAIATEPKLIVLDEPTASLDASVRLGVLDTLRDIQKRLGIAYLLISHDMTTVAPLAHDVVVLYRGVVMERGPAEAVLTRPRHPYTRALLDAVLPPRSDAPTRPTYRFIGPPLLATAAEGCPAYGGCPEQRPACVGARIAETAVEQDHWVACVAVPGPATRLPHSHGAAQSDEEDVQ